MFWDILHRIGIYIAFIRMTGWLYDPCITRKLIQDDVVYHNFDMIYDKHLRRAVSLSRLLRKTNHHLSLGKWVIQYSRIWRICKTDIHCLLYSWYQPRDNLIWHETCEKKHCVKGWAYNHDDVIERKHFPYHWPFVRGIHRSPVNSHHKGQWRGALMFLWFASE